jgi:hypothetical protein
MPMAKSMKVTQGKLLIINKYKCQYYIELTLIKLQYYYIRRYKKSQPN